jgi:hypothetical protein
MASWWRRKEYRVATILATEVDKAMNICSRLMEAADRLMTAVEDLANLKSELERSGLDLTDDGGLVNAALAASSLKHATGTHFENVVSSGATLKTWIETEFHADNFQRVRP